MGTTAQKFQAIVDSKADIKAAINGKGVPVDDAVPFSEYGNKIRQIPTGSGEAVDRTKPILFFDYDGTLIASYTVAEAQALSVLPALPYHDLLTATGWTHTLAQVKAAKVLHVGAMYRTADGKTRAWVTLTPVSGLDLPIRFAITGTATIRVDWGDGQTQNVSAATNILTHNYASAGDYQITLERISGTGTYSLGGGTSTTVFIGTNTNYKQTLTKCHMGDNAGIGAYAFYSCSSLASVVIPQSVTSIGNNVFYFCSSLASVVIPQSVTSIGNNAFYFCYPLALAVVPQGMTSIGDNAFNNCRTLASVVIPQSVTSIGGGVFKDCSSLKELIIESAIPPTLGTDAFTGGSSIRKYYAPDASVDAFKTATNWATYADYFYPISSRP